MTSQNLTSDRIGDTVLNTQNSGVKSGPKIIGSRLKSNLHRNPRVHANTEIRSESELQIPNFFKI